MEICKKHTRTILNECAQNNPCAPFSFYPRWKEYEMLQAAVLNYTLAETQWEIDWTTLLSLANQPGSSLEQIHIFALSHIMRRVSIEINMNEMEPKNKTDSKSH